jgi:hypothetical protein
MKKDIEVDEYSAFLNVVSTQLATANQEPVQTRIQLDRAATNKLLRDLERFDSTAPGLAAMLALLRSVLARRNWLLIGIATDVGPLRDVGFSIGILQAKIPKIKPPRRSPLQKWQQRNFLNRRSL